MLLECLLKGDIIKARYVCTLYVVVWHLSFRPVHKTLTTRPLPLFMSDVATLAEKTPIITNNINIRVNSALYMTFI